MIIKSKVEHSENKSYKKSFTEAAVGLAAKAALGYGFNAVASRVAIPGLKRENLRYIQHFTINGVPYAQATGLASTYKTATVKEAIWNAIKATEEMLLKTPRAFSLSAFYGRSIYQSADIKLEGQALEKQLEYLSKISGGRISKADLAGGLTYRKTKPFGSGSLFNARGEQVLNHAYVYPGLWGEGLYDQGRRVGYTSRFVRALYQQHRMRPPGTDFVITGGNKPWMALTEQVNAFATVAIQNYVKLLDDPFEFVSGHIEKLLGRSNTITKAFGSGSRILERLGLKNQFGVGGYQFMQGSAWQLMKRHALRGVPKLMAIGAAIKIADTILRTTPIVKDTGLGIGVKGIAAKAYQSTTSAFNRISDITGLTWLSKKQEEAAPGSTSILGLLSFPASAAIAGGTAAKIADIIQKVPIDQKGPRPGLFDSAINYISGKGTVGARIHGALSKTGRVGSWAAMGAAAAFLLTAPLYLGAIGASRTTEELKDIYSGREEVPIRRGRFWEFGCLAEHTKIQTKNGWKQAKDVDVGDFVIGSDGNWTKIIKKFLNPPQNKTYKILTSYDRSEPTILTGNHIIPAIKLDYNNGQNKDTAEIKEYRADDLNVGDFVEIPIERINIGNIKQIKISDFIKIGSYIIDVDNDTISPAQINWATQLKQKSRGNTICNTVDLDYAFGRMLGYFMAEGNLSFNKNSPIYIETVHAINEKWIVDDIINICQSKFNITPTFKHRTSYKTAKEGAWIVRIQSTLLARLFFELFYNSNRNNDKQWNELFYEFPQDTLIGFIEGYWYGDGHIQKNANIIKSCRKDLIVGVQKILTSLNYLSNISFSKNNHSGEYRIYWNPFQHGLQNKQNYIVRDNRIFAQIVSIVEEEYSGQVYDFEVENPDHLYKVGAFLVHNSSPFEGTDTEFYAPHWTVRAITDASKKGKLPKEFYENPLLYAINRFVDPYAVERRLDKERPYTYWGPTDYGFGIIEKALYPLKAAFKPTVVANDEAFQGVHPATLMRGAADIPAGLEGTYYGLTTQGYIAEPDSPDSLRYQASEFFGSLRDTFGLQGFAISGIMNALTGGQSFLSPPAVYESSGRILSAQRAYWDMALGGAGGSTEFYRRLNPDRPYETEFVGAPIRNLMPEWIGSESLKYGDVYSQIKMGELRLPGRGYAALYPELENVDAEDYPLVHRLHILSDVAPMSPSYYHHRNLVEQQIAAGELNSEGIDLYERAIRQRDARLNEDRFDYGEGVLGSYYLALKKMGRALPTESLYPISPVHKFAGPADPITEYKSFELLDKPFKLWQNPYADYIKPAINRTVDALSVVPFIPQEARERAEINSYFNALQATKNQFLREEADRRASQGQYEEASYFRSGIRPTVHGMSPFEDFGELTSMLPPNQQRYMESLGEAGDGSYRQKALAIMAPEMQQILSANWVRSDYMVAGDFDTLNILKKNADPISGIDYPATLGGSMPDRDFIGYAPGVDLNALKVKTVNAMGKNIRDFNLWKEDERQAQIFDAITSTNRNFIQPFATPDREQIRRSMEEYLSKIGMRNGRVTLSPTYGPTSVNLNINKNNQNSIHDTMREEGWISY